MIGALAIILRGDLQPADLHGGHVDRDHHDLHRLPAGDGPAADQAAARRVASPAGGRLLAGPLGHPGQHPGGALGRVHDDQPRLAARTRSTTPASRSTGTCSGAGCCCRASSSAASPTTGSSSATRPGRRRARADAAEVGAAGHGGRSRVTREESAMEEFDYVVVGGGTAGAVVAARLSEDPDVSVCLIEAGPSDVGDAAILDLRLDGAARVRLRLGLPRRAPGVGQQLHAPRPREGARRLLVAQLLHRLLGAAGEPRRLGRDGLRGLERRRVLPASTGSRPTTGRATTTAARARSTSAPCRPTTRAASRCWRRARRPGCRRPLQHGPHGDAGRRLVPDQRVRRTTRGCRPRTPTCTRSSASRPNLEVRTGCWVKRVVLDEDRRARGVEYLEPGPVHRTRPSAPAAR